MQLGGGQVSSTLTHATEWAAEAEIETSSPWGNDDLMDLNADQDDWSEMVSCPHANPQMLTPGPGAFETAPVLGHETYDEHPVKTPLPVRAESECFRDCRLKSWNETFYSDTTARAHTSQTSHPKSITDSNSASIAAGNGKYGATQPRWYDQGRESCRNESAQGGKEAGEWD